jgi:Na+/H+ antiporter NhaA
VIAMALGGMLLPALIYISIIWYGNPMLIKVGAYPWRQMQPLRSAF